MNRPHSSPDAAPGDGARRPPGEAEFGDDAGDGTRKTRHFRDRRGSIAARIWLGTLVPPLYGERRNDHHTALAEKRTARAQAAE